MFFNEFVQTPPNSIARERRRRRPLNKGVTPSPSRTPHLTVRCEYRVLQVVRNLFLYFQYSIKKQKEGGRKCLPPLVLSATDLLADDLDLEDALALANLIPVDEVYETEVAQ